MKQQITPEQAKEQGMSIADVVKFYKPDATKEFIDHFLWENTCYPFSREIAINQIYEAYREGKL